MKKIQGKVIRVEKKSIVVVTEDGQFLRVAMPNSIPMTGDIIEISDKKSIRYNKLKPYAAIASVLILVISFSIFNLLLSTKAYAAVALDMTNSSIELTLNKQGKIVKATAKSEQGEKVLKDIDITGIDIYKGINLITSKTGELGYFNPNEKNLALAAVIPLQSRNNQISIDEQKLMNTIHDEMYASKYDGYVIVNSADGSIMEEAYKRGLSVNRYMMWQKSKQSNVNVPEESIRNNSTTDIMRNYNLDMEKMSPDNWCEVYDYNKNKAPSNPQYPDSRNQPDKWDNQPMNPNDSKNMENYNKTNPNYIPDNRKDNWMDERQMDNYRNEQMNGNWRNR